MDKIEYMVACEECGWMGYDKELVPYYPPKEHGDVIPEPSCPKCGSLCLEYRGVRENGNNR